MERNLRLNYRAYPAKMEKLGSILPDLGLCE
jgi:hypothetical protein